MEETIRRYTYQYVTDTRFVPAVGYHFFKIRILPCQNEFQKIIEHNISVDPYCKLTQSIDGQGNIIHYGNYKDLHDHFIIESSGIVECSTYHPIDVPKPYYFFSTPLTQYDEQLKNWAKQFIAENSIQQTAENIMHGIYSYLKYNKNVTSNTTTALDVFKMQIGVCQDFAHLMIAACRSIGIRARYVNGLVTGEGETHAWVEVHDGNQWFGYDPTRDSCIRWDYIKIAHGRDVGDCPLNRGMLFNLTSETLNVKTTIEMI